MAFHDWKHSFLATTDEAFIRSEINGRRSRRIVLSAFFCADAVGGALWAFWCEDGIRHSATPLEDSQHYAQACRSFGINHYLLWGAGIPLEGWVLWMAGRDPWSFWSDAWLLPVWLVRLGLLDVLLWNVPPQILVGDALWFSAIAVMCRVHSVVLCILVGFEVCSLMIVLAYQGGFMDFFAFDHVRYGMYSVAMLIIMAGAYFLDEQTRLQSYEQVMSLQDQNAALAEMMLRWKVLPEVESGNGGNPVPQDNSLDSGSISSCVTQRPPLAKASIARWTGAVGGGRASSSRVRFALPSPPPAVPTRRPQRGLGGEQRARDLLDVIDRKSVV